MSHDYNPWFSLFNGDPLIPNTFFNNLGSLPFNFNRYILIDRLSLEECINLSELFVFFASEILKYLYITQDKLRKVSPTIKGIMIAKITKEKGFEWVKIC